MVYPLLWQLTMGEDSCFKWSVHMNHGIIIALSWWEYWKIYLHAQCKELIGVCFQGHIATLDEPKKTGRVVMRHFQYSAAPVHRALFTLTHTHTDWNTFCLWPLATVILLLKVSLHLIHNGPPCLLMLWCFFFKSKPPLRAVAWTRNRAAAF